MTGYVSSFAKTERLKYAIIELGPMTESGYHEVVGWFVFKAHAEQFLKFTVPDKKERRHFKIVKLLPKDSFSEAEGPL